LRKVANAVESDVFSTGFHSFHKLF